MNDGPEPLDILIPQPAKAAGTGATRGQRIALLVGVVVVLWLMLQLFESILLPFVAAAGIAYVLDPFCRRLARLRVPRGAAALLLVMALVTGVLLFALLLYPLVLSQVALLAGRVPDYVRGLSAFAAKSIAQLQQHWPDYVDAKLSDLVSSQAGAMLSFLLGALTRIVGGGFALFNVLSLLVVTPVVSFYLLRDWPGVTARVDSWIPRRYQTVVRAQAREVDRILSAWVRGQAMCCMILALFYALGLSIVGLDLGLVVGLSAGTLSFIPYVGSVAGRGDSDRAGLRAIPELGWRDPRGAGVRGRPNPGRLCDLSALSGRPGGIAGGVGDLRAVRRRRRVRLSGRDAGRAGGGHRGCAGAVLVATLLCGARYIWIRRCDGRKAGASCVSARRAWAWTFFARRGPRPSLSPLPRVGAEPSPCFTSTRTDQE